MPVPRILSVGEKRSLMLSRAMLLRHSGYEVDEAYTVLEALKIAESNLPNVVLICHTVSQAERELLISRVRRQPQLIQILCIDNTGIPSPMNGCQVVPNAPEELLAALNSVVRQARSAG